MKKALLLILLVASVIALNAQNDTTKYGVVIPKGFTAQIDVVYDKVGDWEGKVDIYLPPNTGKPTPILINIHGGGWNHGNKEKQKGFGSFFKNKMAVANMGYRLVDVAPAPAAIEDVRSVLAYLVKNAKELNIDVNKIVVMGGSAGGHLAMMGGYLGDNILFDQNRKDLKDLKVAAVIDKYGIADMVDFSVGPKPYKSAVRWIGKKIDNVAFIRSVSPLYHINKNTPPTFIVHGDADPIVPYSQSVELKKKLDEFGVKNIFITVEGGEHGKFPQEKQREISRSIISFLKKVKVIE
ncbi:alpha/beta hydrolase [Dysgonomonas sp. 511]|uniref:alpha/beta hydrolase n=1 Tax=Dysgonomonas sp. 511 TaxID=2302930 RepID=UPI0013D5EC2B|nr:alpha/beta hydrolase [Dysgonomonas sp. 511]NDV78158.1 alpha/beta hydrolase [Dysgonomonas sp. 511]